MKRPNHLRKSTCYWKLAAPEGQPGFRSITKERNLAELLPAAFTGDCEEVPAEWKAILVAVYPVAMNTSDDFGRLPIHPLCHLSKKRGGSLS